MKMAPRLPAVHICFERLLISKGIYPSRMHATLSTAHLMVQMVCSSHGGHQLVVQLFYRVGLSTTGGACQK